ncbi:MAG: glycoside hydrolase family 88 protein [Saprospiraceae bacterium]|nr:glycoside hydrolase family 88 protein [Saprospiraceae bacterium]
MKNHFLLSLMRLKGAFLLLLFAFTEPLWAKSAADSLPTSADLAKRFAQTIMTTYPDSIVVKKFVQHMMQDKQGTDPDKRPASWNYEEAVVLRGIENLWRTSHNRAYYDYMKKIIDHFINEDGTIRTYERHDYNSDQVTGGLLLITLYRETQQEKYKKAADVLRQQITWQPRTKEGGFWHKHKYPYQMWLDCMYMLNVYYAEYCHYFKTPQYFTDVANQFIWLHQHAKDPKTGLLYHGWDESKSQLWANPKTGQSPEVWGRSMGWYVMALVETLDVFPKNHPKRPQLLKILTDLAAVLAKYQDVESGVWYQIVDKATWKGNYLEASGSTMFTYALAKGVRKGYLDKKYLAVAQKGYDGLLKNFIDIDEKGLIHIHKSCSGAGLGGTPYRSGTYEYYINEPQRSDDLKTIGPLINAMLEMDKMGYRSPVVIKQH